MSRIVRTLVVALALSAAGCAATTGQVAVKDKGKASGLGAEDQAKCEWKGREDREMTETAGPGALLPNVRRVYQVVGTGEDRRKVIVCREVDTNLDGIKDMFRTFGDKGEALREEADTNYDGKIDTWITFASGRIAKVSLDNDGDGTPEEWKYYGGGQLSRVERDTNKDGKSDIFEFYLKGQVERIGVDVDFDGHVDRWDHDELQRRMADAADKATERSSGATGAGASVVPQVAPATPAEEATAPAPKTGGSKRRPKKPASKP